MRRRKRLAVNARANEPDDLEDEIDDTREIVDEPRPSDSSTTHELSMCGRYR